MSENEAAKLNFESCFFCRDCWLKFGEDALDAKSRSQ